MKRFTVQVLIAGALVAGLGLISFEVGSARQQTAAGHLSMGASQGRLLRTVSAGERWGFEAQSSAQHGAEIYQAKCSVCHGAELKGMAPMFPSLIDVTKRMSEAQITTQIHNGKGRMLAFPELNDDDLHSLYLFLQAPLKTDEAMPSEKSGA